MSFDRNYLLEMRAKAFATLALSPAHLGRTYEPEANPHIARPAAVARLVAQTPGCTSEMVAAAWLYDIHGALDVSTYVGSDVAALLDDAYGTCKSPQAHTIVMAVLACSLRTSRYEGRLRSIASVTLRNTPLADPALRHIVCNLLEQAA